MVERCLLQFIVLRFPYASMYRTMRGAVNRGCPSLTPPGLRRFASCSLDCSGEYCTLVPGFSVCANYDDLEVLEVVRDLGGEYTGWG